MTLWGACVRAHVRLCVRMGMCTCAPDGTPRVVDPLTDVPLRCLPYSRAYTRGEKRTKVAFLRGFLGQAFVPEDVTSDYYP